MELASELLAVIRKYVLVHDAATATPLISVSLLQTFLIQVALVLENRVSGKHQLH